MMEMLSRYLALKFCPARWRAAGPAAYRSGKKRTARLPGVSAAPLPLRSKNGEADFLLQQLDLIGKGGLAHKQIVRRAAEIQCPASSMQ
jgi:hypothetical protein